MTDIFGRCLSCGKKLGTSIQCDHKPQKFFRGYRPQYYSNKPITHQHIIENFSLLFQNGK